jgi:predicted DNA-binding mobile mystery protein A
MIDLTRKLKVDQLDRKLTRLKVLGDVEIPPKGWINAIRTTINMSLSQLGKRLGKTPVAVKEMEEREESRTITLKKLIEVGNALDLHFVYGFIPRGSSIQEMIQKRAEEVAREIVMRTSHTMALEDQENSRDRLRQAIRERAQLLVQELPKHLWD